MMLTAFPAGPIGLDGVSAASDFSCVNFEILGVCPSDSSSLLVGYWEPALLIETVKNPGDMVIEGLGGVVSGITREAGKTLLSSLGDAGLTITSGNVEEPYSQGKMQFNEVHIYSLSLSTSLSFCSSYSSGITIHYLSELDGIEWRRGDLEMLNPKSLAAAAAGPLCGVAGQFRHNLGICMGYWGPLYPRRGFIIHASEVAGSAAAAVRAVSVASGLDTPHVVLSSLKFTPNFDKDKLQLVYPVSRGCIRIGQNPATWETSKGSSHGKYLWIYWRYRICCV